MSPVGKSEPRSEIMIIALGRGLRKTITVFVTSASGIFSDRGEKGFSLLELMVVLLLLGLSSVLVLPSIDRGLREREVRRSALELAAVARELRSRAVYENTLQRLIFDPFENSYQALWGKKVLSSEIKITGIEGGEPAGEGLRQFLFFPNGSILGGKVGISSREGSTYIIRFDPLSGRVVVVRGGANEI